MDCADQHCRLNDELLALLPALDPEEQQCILRRWPELDLEQRESLLGGLREPVSGQADLMALAKLADYFQCGVYDMVRYTRLADQGR